MFSVPERVTDSNKPCDTIMIIILLITIFKDFQKNIIFLLICEKIS